MSNSDRFYKIEDEQGLRFYQMPKVLFNNERYKGLSLEAKATYSILRDRQDLSVKNGWTDKEGHIYSHYTVESLCEILEVANGKVTSIKKELVKYGLLIDKRQGQGKPNRLYILKPEFIELDTYSKNTKKDDPEPVENTKTCENRMSKDANRAYQDMRNSHTNDTDFNDTDSNDTQSFIQEKQEEKKNERMNENNINELQDIYNKSEVEYIQEKVAVKQAIKVLYYSDKPLKVNGMSVPLNQVREDLKQLEYKHIVQAINDYQEGARASKITNHIAYLGTCIYNAIFSIDIKVQAELMNKGII